MEMSAPMKPPVNAQEDSATHPIVPLTETPVSKSNPESVAVPIGVLEVPIGVWGSRRVEFNSAQSERVEVFAEDTCTVIVFPQGAVIRLSASVEPGQLIMIANRNSGQIMLCRIVKVRTYPNIRGYAEIEFMHSATGFWGAYAAQGTLTLTARRELAVPSTAADFWSNGFPNEIASVLSSAVTASPAAPTVRNEKESIEKPGKLVQRVATIATNSGSCLGATGRNSSDRNPLLVPTSTQGSARFQIGALLFWWWRQPTARTDAARTPAPRRRLVFASVVPAILLLGVFGVFSLVHDGTEQLSGISQTSPMPEVSLGSPTANVVQSQQPKSDVNSVMSELPIANPENFPGTQPHEFADVRISHPSERKATSERKIPNGRLLAPRSTTNRSAAMGQDQAPELTGVDSNTGIGALQGVLATLLPRGGRAKEPELLFSSAPIYPAMARQARVEGQVTIEAVIDTTGKLTNMTVISGAPMLQQAALDSLRSWKYQPGYLNEKPVPTKASITVNFHLQ